jgi:hypothetical protein
MQIGGVKKTMQHIHVRTVFDGITDFLAAAPTPEAFLSYHLPDTLLERNGEGLLNKNSMDFRRADEGMALLKAKTQLRLRKPKS